MKDFALDLIECSEGDRLKVENLAFKQGVEWVSDDCTIKEDDIVLSIEFYNGKYVMNYYNWTACNEIIYQMPKDWNKIQAALGVETTPKYVEITIDIESAKAGDICKVSRRHEIFNGVWIVEDDNSYSFWVGLDKFKPSTKEAYDAQEAKKKVGSLTFKYTAFDTDILKLENAILKIEVERLNRILGVANKQAALVMEENKVLIERNEKMDKLYNAQLKISHDLQHDKDLLRRKIRELSSIACNM